MALTSDIAVASAQSYLPSVDPSPWVRNGGRAGREDAVAQQGWLGQAGTQAQVLPACIAHLLRDISLPFTLK